MVIAVDFDETLTDKRIERLILKFSEQGNEVWVVTARRDNEFSRSALLPVLKRLKLTIFNVMFCNGKPKIDFLEAIGADMYIDNEYYEFEAIASNTETVPLLWQN